MTVVYPFAFIYPGMSVSICQNRSSHKKGGIGKRQQMLFTV